MALVLAGATKDSVCQNELQTVFQLKSHEDFPLLSQQVISSNKTGTGVSLTSANGIWSRSSLKHSYVDTIQQVHGAEASDLPETYAPIDAYITKKTNGLIENMMGGDPIDALTVAVLVNAVHFKGDWTTQFDKKLTTRGTFTNLYGEKKQAAFMKATRKMPFAQDVRLLGGASIVQLDYGKQKSNDTPAEYAAFFILPKEKGQTALHNVVERLSTLHAKKKSFSSILDQMSSQNKLELTLPRFKLSYGTRSLKKELRSLGVNSCFDDDMALLELSEDPTVHLHEVFHKAVLEVTEEGTEAAAATAAIMRARSLPMPPTEMTFDRPFLMLILHMPSLTPLFLARADNPDLIF